MSESFVALAERRVLTKIPHHGISFKQKILHLERKLK